MIHESCIENTTCSFLPSDILPQLQGTKTQTQTHTHTYTQENVLFVAARQFFIPRTGEATGDRFHTQEYEANKMEFSHSVLHFPHFPRSW